MKSEYQQLVQFLGDRFAGVDRRFVAINHRLDSLERRVDEGFREVTGRFDEIDRRLDRLEQEFHTILQGGRRIEALLVEEQVKREIRERAWTS